MGHPERIMYEGYTYVRADAAPKTIRIAGKTYVLAQMTTDQAAKAALDIATDISALGLYLKGKGLEKDYQNMQQISHLFGKTSDQLADMAAKE